MVIISVVLEKGQARVALYDKKYRLSRRKEGTEEALTELCLEVISKAGFTTADVAYIGIASDRSPNAACADLKKSIDVPYHGASLISAKALGEAYMANDVPTLLLLKIEDTVESGIVIDKKIYSGAHHLGGKIAHMVINCGGYECACGRKGCFEAYVGLPGLRRIAAESGVADSEALTHATLFAMNTPSAELAKKRYVEYLASGVTNIINLFQPNELVLEGPFSEIGDELMAPLMDIVLHEQYSRSIPNKCNIRFPGTEADTALLGAALLGR